MPTKKHAYAELLPSEKQASQGKNVRTNTRNSAFPRALLLNHTFYSLSPLMQAQVFTIDKDLLLTMSSVN